jgi:thiol-disulfide isomerase/thioredoxin
MQVPRRKLLTWGAAGVAAAGTGAFFGARQFQVHNAVGELLGEPFTDLQGHTVRLRDWSAPVLLCNFWATWCEPCRDEVPLLVAAKQHFGPYGIEIVGIGVDRADKLLRFSLNYRIIYPIVIATGRTPDLLRELGNSAGALPYSVLLNRNRRITHRKLGAWRKGELDREIEAAIG